MLLDVFYKNATEIIERKEEPEVVLDLVRGFPAVDVVYEDHIKQGGIHAYSRALRVFGLTKDENAKNIMWWNEESTWKHGYREFFKNAWTFAEDVFGNQFMFDSKGVAWLDIETGELKFLCSTFSQWIKLINDDSDFYTGEPIARIWEEAYPEEPLTGMYHLCPVQLFVCKGDYTLENLWRSAAQGHMAMNASIAQQIKDLPDGTKIELTFED